ncbi:MAG: energy transducer TonB [Bacteroidales bacterium]|nr:energy transducer TonB [Bacteroidales bacterium]
MKSFLLFLTFFMLTLCQSVVNGQNIISKNDTTIYLLVDTFPILIANNKHYKIDDIKEFIQENTYYPNNDADCQGSVIISIVVEKDGTVKHKEFVRKLCEGYDENAMKVINLMVKWKPGIKNGVTVRTKLNLKVKWKLE